MSLKGKRFVITGAASGIGRASAITLSELEATLVLIDKDIGGLHITANHCKSGADLRQFDLSNTKEISALINDVVSEHGPMDGFAHIAGVSYLSPLKTISSERYESVMRINAYSGLEIAKSLSKKGCHADGMSSFVYISSIYGLVGTAANCGYALSKSAILGLTKSLAAELASKKIRVNCIAPGFVVTNMMDDTGMMFSKDYIKVLNDLHPLGLGSAEDIAMGVAFLLSDASNWITGAILPIDGGYTAI